MTDLKSRPIVTVHFAKPIVIQGSVMTSADVNLPLVIEESPKGIVLTKPRKGERPERVVLVPWSNVVDVLFGEPA